MNMIKRFTPALAALTSLAMISIAIVPFAQAASAQNMQVAVEVWNDGEQEMQMPHASWISNAAQLSGYRIDALHSGTRFNLTLNNPRNDSATFRYATAEGKQCEFKLSHEAEFSWFSINPAPKKSATARSNGTVDAECAASVTRGKNSLESYSVRFSMK